MSKIIAAANSMIANQNKIGNVIAGEQSSTDIFFTYDNKFKWSINKTGDGYWLYFYPGDASIETLAATWDWDSVGFVTYSTKEIGSREAVDTFSELYTLVKEKLYGVDDALNEIINDMRF